MGVEAANHQSPEFGVELDSRGIVLNAKSKGTIMRTDEVTAIMFNVISFLVSLKALNMTILEYDEQTKKKAQETVGAIRLLGH